MFLTSVYQQDRTFPAPGSRLPAPGSRLPAPGSNYALLKERRVKYLTPQIPCFSQQILSFLDKTASSRGLKVLSVGQNDLFHQQNGLFCQQEVCCEFAELDDSDKDCILRISQALSFASLKPYLVQLFHESYSEEEVCQWT
jgi:hypothetical protein